MRVIIGTPKIRKMLLKDIKGKVVELLNHRWGHLVILRALMVTDDTVLLTKGILNELVDAEGSPITYTYPMNPSTTLQ